MKSLLHASPLLWLAALTLAACLNSPTEETQHPARAQPLTERFAALASPSKKLQVGEECTKYEGNSACESDLCLRVAPGFPPKGFCSIQCDPGNEMGCPDGPAPWACLQVFPSTDGWVCAPPKTFVSAVATLKGAKFPLPPRKVLVTPSAGFDGGER